jgi:hypothetical protein
MSEEQLQRTDFWNAQRKYKFTSSSIHKLMSEPKSTEDKAKGLLSGTAKSYILEKIAQELDGFIPDVVSEATVWGIEKEDKARKWYEKLTGNVWQAVGFEKYNEFYGGSPDGKVIAQDGSVGALEIKCPYNSVNHLKHCLIDSADYFRKEHAEYYWQCVSHMVTLGKDIKFCDFVSFDDRIQKNIGFFIFRLKRDIQVENQMLVKIEKANEYKLEIMRKFKLIP